MSGGENENKPNDKNFYSNLLSRWDKKKGSLIMYTLTNRVNVENYDYEAGRCYVDDANYKNELVAAWFAPATRKADGKEGYLVWIIDNPLADDTSDTVSDWDTAYFVE